ncbi:unnamed protein product [Adineta ricciae]|uniref:Uncharacterized protein n=1 Tax=Adineta ricciae TaxID=249248 RepID=A0A815PZ37_ADIRI|nr:unnamed protein product [Adineta ricciae]
MRVSYVLSISFIGVSLFYPEDTMGCMKKIWDCVKEVTATEYSSESGDDDDQTTLNSEAVSLEGAVKFIASLAKRNCTTPFNGLTCDESVAIQLYTMECEPRSECLYFVLNSHLRKENRSQLEP